MAYQAKTKVEPLSVAAFLDSVDPPNRQAEARRLVTIFAEVTGWQPRLYTGGMIGFGSYDYTYDSGHSGRSMATGFAPRKADLSIYILPGYDDMTALLARLGKHRIGKACLYLRHLSDADEVVLRQIIAQGLDGLRQRWPVTPT
jgi:hypothetical protein